MIVITGNRTQIAASADEHAAALSSINTTVHDVGPNYNDLFNISGSEEARGLDGQHPVDHGRAGIRPRQRRSKVARDHHQVRQHPAEEEQVHQLRSGSIARSKT